MTYFPAELIKKKRAGLAHDRAELEFLINGFVAGTIPDYQMAAWLMAVFFKGMTATETSELTHVMLHSGRTLDFSSLHKPVVDKHSTGGVGDKTSLILAPLVAAAGIPVPMIAGRGLGHTGGTLDKLEALPGFRIALSLDEFQAQVAALGTALTGQTAEICPADKRIYALRDVTGTIESLPLICASIMSKKLAEGINGLVLDVKHGSGAFMKTVEQADLLADKLMEIGQHHGKRVIALLTRMDEPLGRFIGNAVEVGECIAIMKNEPYLGRPPEDFADTRELTLELAAAMLWVGGASPSLEHGRAQAEDLLVSGKAWQKFAEICRAQGGQLEQLPTPTVRQVVRSTANGYVAAYDTEKLGLAAIAMGGGRLKTSDVIDPVAGIEVHKKLGDAVVEGETLFTLLGGSRRSFDEASAMVVAATTISLQKPVVPSLITKRKVI
ncbi:MAG: thymidine phosphorylase [Bdellovibrionaceae bacterium]|nr:thymidine phosphorylase [Pseudobdellovibrionaceae bacterium]